ncbi:MAG TPA: endonuclease domain-containing protein [Phnomibacter sp.]|nr:endonuclease domain-containing protein [Phnomibacter sp.]
MDNQEKEPDRKSDAGRKDLLSFAEGGMFHGTPPQIFERASLLRKNMTEAEKILWYYLKQGVNGLKFRRQHPIRVYIADFYCHKMKLVIELDGSVHDDPEVAARDQQREDDLKSWGYEVIRFKNAQVFKNVESVMAIMEEKVTAFLDKSL